MNGVLLKIIGVILLVANFSCRKKGETEENANLSGETGAIVVSGDTPVEGTAVIVTTDNSGNNTVTTVGGNTVASVNPLPPVWDSLIGNVTVMWGDPISMTAMATDPNPGQPVSYSFDVDNMTCDNGVWTVAISIDSSTGQISGTPSEVDQGTCTVKVLASSGGDSVAETFTIIISSTPVPLVWENTIADFVLIEGGTISSMAQAKDENVGDVISYHLDSSNMTCDDGFWSPNIAVHSSTGILSGVPQSGDVGSCTVKILAESAGDTIQQTFTITIASLNHPPTWDSLIGDLVQAEDAPLSGVIAAASDMDAGDTPIYSLDLGNMTCDNGAWNPGLAIDTNSGEITGTPVNDDVGSCTIKIDATSNGDTISEIINVTVTNTNDMPTWNSTVADFSLTFNVPISGTSADAIDVDPGSSITYSFDEPMDCDDNASWFDSPIDIHPTSGVISGTPNSDGIGNDCTVKYTALSGGDSISHTFTLTIVNTAPPSFTSEPGDTSLSEDSDISSLGLAARDWDATDPDSDDGSIVYSFAEPATTCNDGTFSPALTIDSSSGVLTAGTPLNDDVGTCQIVIRASVDGQSTDSSVLTLTIINTADAPTWQTEVVNFDHEVGVALTGKTEVAIDVDAGETPSYSLDYSNMTCDDGSWSPAVAVDSSAGVVTGTPRSGDIGSCTIRVAAESGGDTIYTSFTVTVTATASPPTEVVFVAPGAIVAGDCALVEVQTLDALGFPANVGSNETVALGVNNGTGTYYTSDTCGTPTTTATITSGNHSQSVYFMSATAPQSLTLIGISPSYANANHSMNVGSSATALLVSAAPEIVSGTCSKITIFRVDTFGNKISEDSEVLLDLSEDNNASFFSDSSCATSITQASILALEDRVHVYVKDSIIETLVLTATDNDATLATDNTTVEVVGSLTWWNASWNKRIRIQIDNLDQAVTFSNQPVRVKLDETRVDYSDFKSGGADIAFVASDNGTPLDFDIDVWNPSGDSYLWVKVDSITASSSDNFIFMYYGNAGASSTANAANVWSDYFGVWHLEEDPASGSPQYEDSTGANDGTATNSPGQTLGVTGNSIDVSGSNDTIDTGVDLSTVIGATSTMSVWLKTNQSGNDTMWAAPGITGVEEAGGGNDIFFGWIDASGNIGVTVGNGAHAKSNFIVNDNVWRHVTITRDHISGAIQFFVNGVKNSTGVSETGIKSLSFSEFGIIGDSGGSPEDLNGAMDEIHIYSGVQTDARIKADFKYQLDTYLGYSIVESQ